MEQRWVYTNSAKLWRRFVDHVYIFGVDVFTTAPNQIISICQNWQSTDKPAIAQIALQDLVWSCVALHEVNLALRLRLVTFLIFFLVLFIIFVITFFELISWIEPLNIFDFERIVLRCFTLVEKTKRSLLIVISWPEIRILPRLTLSNLLVECNRSW